MEPEPELILEDASALRDAMRRMVRYAWDATEPLEARGENEGLDSMTEVEELCEALERVQNLSLKISEQLDAYQDRHDR